MSEKVIYDSIEASAARLEAKRARRYRVHVGAFKVRYSNSLAAARMWALIPRLMGYWVQIIDTKPSS